MISKKRAFGSLAFATALALGGTTAARAAEVKIGIVLGVTGTFSFVGQSATNAMKLAYDDLQATNFLGNTKVTPIYEDNRSDKQEAITLFTKMAKSDGVVAILGPVSSGEAQATAPVATDLKIVMYTTATTPDTLKVSNWIFKAPENAESFMTTLGNYVAQTSKPKSCFIVSIRDNDGYIRQKDIFRDVIAKGGVKIAAEESILAADSDFTALSTKIANAQPDCLFLSTPPEQGANIIIQAQQAGMSPKALLVGNTGMSTDQYVKAGGKAVEGTLVPAEFVPEGVNEQAALFVAKYTKRFGRAPDNFAAEGYTMMSAMLHAIKAAGDNVTPERVRDELAKTKNLPSPLGSGSYMIGPDRVPQYGMVVLKLVNGKYVKPDTKS